MDGTQSSTTTQGQNLDLEHCCKYEEPSENRIHYPVVTDLW